MNNFNFLSVFLSVFFSFVGCTPSDVVNEKPNYGQIENRVDIGEKNNMQSEVRKNTYQDISPKDAKKMLEENKETVLLDVRTLEEYEESHIPNSVLLPLDELQEKAEEKLQNKEAPILVYCRSGRRSITASNILIEKGYKNVYNLGGIIDWPYEIER